MLADSYYRLHAYFRTHTPRLYRMLYRRKKIIKYIFSGGTATATNLIVLYLCTSLLHLYYLLSSVLAFILSLGVSFSLQKFWTFEDPSKDALHTQLALYTAVVLIDIALNTFLVYVFVQWCAMWYVAAQFLAGVFIAVINFFAYRNLVFKR
jgi:putative flippase GtrA